MTTPVTRASPASMKIYHALRGDIVMGKKLPRERLIEADLAERFQHSRAIVREALSLLLAAGLVTFVPNKGASVAETSAAELDSIYRVRIELEATAASWVALPLDRAIVKRLEDIQKEHSKAVRERRLGDVFELNERFHAALYAGCGNPYLEELIATMATRGIIGRYSSSMAQSTLTALRDDHQAMIAAVKAEDRGALVAVVRRHLARGRDWYAARAPRGGAANAA